MAPQLRYAEQFFATARERYRIKLRRDAGQNWPWTNDEHFRTWRFTNVHREDDRTTVWLRENIREPLSERIRKYEEFHNQAPSLTTAEFQELLDLYIKLVEGVLIFRWFNRISTGEIIKDLLLGKWDTKEAFRRLEFVTPVVTGAYIIKAGDGVSKLEGILNCIDGARPQLPRMVNAWLRDDNRTLKSVWSDLKTIYFMGGFMAYEVVTDLRWTPLLDKASDIMTWGNLGPGAIRGISWVVHGHAHGFSNSVRQQGEMLDYMAQLLTLSKDEKFWPQEWPHWEMHEVEMWLCEFAKYMAAYTGSPQKRRYRR